MTVALSGDLHRGPDTHTNRPAATAVGVGTLYRCTTHDLIYRSDGAAWSTYAAILPAGGTTGDVLTFDGSTWISDAPSGGGGGATVAPYFAATSGAGDITLTAPTSYTDITGLSLSVAAAIGDKLLIQAMVSVYTTASDDPNVGIVVAGTVKSKNGYANQGPSRPVPVPVQWLHTVVSGDISGGNVAVKVQGQISSGNLLIYNNATRGITATLSVLNLGH